nr:tetraacyldisaccharide 4'-kinase [Hyphomonas johnsonii]
MTRLLLSPLAFAYRLGVQNKLKKAVPVRVDIPVICIGNLTVGGVGKTPVVAAIRALLTARGVRTATLSRGYGGGAKGVVRVQTGTHTAADVGDEPLMLAASGESWIGRDRVAAARAMQADGVQVIVMDDGHQNPSLHKDLSLVVIDAAAPFGNGHLLPKGPLREPVADGLSRAGGVVLMGAGDVPTAAAKSGLPVLRATVEPTSAIPDGPLVAFAGIGRPIKFFDALKAAGADLREAVGYGDHHAYSDGELKFLHSLAERHGARLVTTTKDHVRLPQREQQRVLAFPVAARFEDPGALDALLDPIVKSANA